MFYFCYPCTSCLSAGSGQEFCSTNCEDYKKVTEVKDKYVLSCSYVVAGRYKIVTSSAQRTTFTNAVTNIDYIVTYLIQLIINEKVTDVEDIW